MRGRAEFGPLNIFHPAIAEWFTSTFGSPTQPQMLGWPAIARGESTLILAPTGTGKTLTAFLWCLNQLMFQPRQAVAAKTVRRSARRRSTDSAVRPGCRVVYISPLKALAVDVERNLRAPLAGIARAAAARGDEHAIPSIALRTGDTPTGDRARFRRDPADILITTPESLYLLLTSNARETLTTVDTIIVDEIHALVPTKRGAHLAVSLERLASRCEREPQRIGLSATQRPLDEVARFLGGVEPTVSHAPPGKTRPRERADAESEVEHEFAGRRRSIPYRPITVIDAGATRPLKLTVEVPAGDGGTSAWSSIQPRLLELIRAHESTLLFVNSRRLAERLAGGINELAGETLVRSHHGSLAREQRTEVEDLLKAGRLKALVATSSLELGIDMGAIDLVVQIEAPPSVASGLQRIGRSGHTINAVSEGVIFPKFRGDLLAAAAVSRAMHDGAVEASHYPRNPLDIAAQQIVAMVSMDDWPVDALFATLRSAAPFADLSRSVFEGVLDMLSGRYPSDEFAELRPRITWHRAAARLTAREGAKRVAVINGGTIPDRGLYGVFLAGSERSQGSKGSVRVGELDEEMVFETRVGETFVLGASTWRVEEITHDRVLVSAAPGQPGKMPFWKGERAGRPLELGLAIGRLAGELLALPVPSAVDRLIRDHDLDANAAETLLQYLRDQKAATRTVPDDRTIVVERVRDELGDWRICVLSPRGGPVHAPWAMAAAALIEEKRGFDVETLWGDDGFVVRFPDVDEPPDASLFVPDPSGVHALVARQVGATALFAGKFRENAARSLLLPKRRPGARAPLWHQRKRAADLLAVASRYGSFPILLETYRECLRDFFDMPALVSTLADIRSGAVSIVTVDSEHPSPFAASLLFSYVANFIYDGDTPLAERRAQALAVDQSQLRELIGDAELREILDEASIEAVEQQLQRLDGSNQPRTADGVHDLLLALGDLSDDELRARTASADPTVLLDSLLQESRIVALQIGGERRYVAIEDAARYRDALGVALPPRVPPSLLESGSDPLGNLAHRYARTHAPFTAREFASRYSLRVEEIEALLARLTAENRLLGGEFRPKGIGREWTEAGVLRTIRRRSLARLRHEVEPVDPNVLGRFATRWHGTVKRRPGADALLDSIEQLQGAPLAASILETEILPARIEGYDSGDLDSLMAAGEVVWVGIETVGEHDGRLALYLADQLGRLALPSDTGNLPDREAAIVEHLRSHGASFFSAIHEAAGGGYPAETVTALWALAWRGIVTNDTFHAVRAFTRNEAARRSRRPEAAAPFRSRRLVPESAEGRWSMVHAPGHHTVDVTAWAKALTEQLLARHGVLTREAVAAESIRGGFSVIYPVLKRLEESGRIRRGYFVAGLGATQFALPGAVEQLRSLRDRDSGSPEAVVLAATDPANPYGAALSFPKPAGDSGRRPTRTTGATVIIVNGAIAAYLTRGDRQLWTWIPEAEPMRSRTLAGVARGLKQRADDRAESQGLLIEEIDGLSPAAHPLAPFLIEAGFLAGAMGMSLSRH